MNNATSRQAPLVALSSDILSNFDPCILSDPAAPAQSLKPEKPLLQFALDYARRGWAVFPCKPSNKAPYTASGFKDASTDPATIARWWQTWPNAMIGVRMGAASGVWALDPDPPKNPGDPDGRATWASLKQEHGGHGPTHSHNTPRGGQHVLFKYRPDKPVTTSEGDIKKQGINVRGEGGYIIAPPSVRADGEVYEIAESLDFFNFADAPDWLYDLILPKISEQATATVRPLLRDRNSSHRQRYAEAALRGECDELAATPPGSRNQQLNNAALKLGTLVAAGELSQGEVIGALYDAAISNGLVADGKHAVMATINSGLSKGMQTPRAIPEPQARNLNGHSGNASNSGDNLDLSDCVSLDDFYAYMPMHSYIFVPTRAMWPASSVNGRIAPIPALNAAGGTKTISASAWLDQNKPVEQMTWAPGLPMIIGNRLMADGGWIEKNGVSCFNQYRPPTIKPGDPTAVEPWLDHARMVFGEYSAHIIQWLAHRVQRPEVKINHALVLGGAPGIGKDTLIEPAKRAVGEWNCREVTPKQVIGRFNGHLKSVILRISEARDLGDIDRFKFYNHMKVYTASPPDVLCVDEKHIPEYSVLNVCGVVITTNYKTDGIYLPPDDRRHFVAWSDQPEGSFTPADSIKLWDWYNGGGDRNVAAYLATLDISAFDPKAPPPKTPAFWDIADAGRAPEESELADALDRMNNPDATTLIRITTATMGELEIWLKDRRNRRAIPHRLEKCGYVAVRNDTAKDGLWVINGIRQVVYAKSSLSIHDRIKAARRLTNPS